MLPKAGMGAVATEPDMSAPEADGQPEVARPTCRCGHDRDHFMVSPVPQYTGLDWVWVLLGITTMPFEVQFRCRRCQQVFDQTRDPAIMRRVI